jgi:trehalose/maltose hydrolase-like predicted phosphorylase
VAHLVDDDLAGLRSLHTSNWREIWEGGRIELDTTDLQLQKAVAGSLYYLYSNLPSHRTYTPNTQFYGLSPGGLANGRNGSDYYGHVFWDMVSRRLRGIDE